MTKRPTKAQTTKWERILAKDGLQPLSGWYDQYSTLGGPVLVQLDEVEKYLDELQTDFSAGDDFVRLEDTADAIFWREAYYKANALPRGNPNRRFLIAVADSGNVEGTALALGKTTRWGWWRWAEFLSTQFNITLTTNGTKARHAK